MKKDRLRSRNRVLGPGGGGAEGERGGVCGSRGKGIWGRGLDL